MIQIRVTNESISIWNHGLLPKELTNESLKVIHKSVPRNPLIAGVCFKAGYIDSWGRGTTKIIDECLKQGLPEPQLIEFQGGFEVTLFKDANLTIHDTTHDTTHDNSIESSPEIKILALLSKSEASKIEITSALGLKNDRHVRKTYLAPMLSANLIVLTLPDKPQSKNQKYKITTKGLSHLSRNS